MSRIVFASALVMGLGSLSFSAESEPRPPHPTEIDRPDIQERLSRLPALRAQLFFSEPQVEQDGKERFSAAGAGVKRTQTVKVNPTAVSQMKAAVPLRLDQESNAPSVDPTKHVLNFFDVDLNVVNLEQKRNELGLIVWRGTVAGDPYSSVTLVFDNGAVTGRVMTQGRVFAITPMGQGLHRLSEIDESAQPNLEDDAIRPPLPEPGAANPHLFRNCAMTTLATDDPAHVRVGARLLGHSSLTTSEQHYNHATMLSAVAQYHETLAQLRGSEPPTEDPNP